MRNKVQLIGNLGTDPVVKAIENGKTVARFSMATTEVYKNKSGEQVKDTHWHNVVVWGKLAESVGKTMAKGSEVAIEGRLHTRNYEDKNGAKRYVTEVLLSDYLVIKGRKIQ